VAVFDAFVKDVAICLHMSLVVSGALVNGERSVNFLALYEATRKTVQEWYHKLKEVPSNLKLSKD